MPEQSYQEVAKEVARELSNIEKHLNDKDFHGFYQDYFYKLKKKEPKRFERLMYDESGHIPFCRDLSSIISNFKISGIIEQKYVLNHKKLNEYLNESED
jgi:hypothetical protein